MEKYADTMKNDLNTFLSVFNQEDLRVMEKTLRLISQKISENASIQI